MTLEDLFPLPYDPEDFSPATPTKDEVTKDLTGDLNKEIFYQDMMVHHIIQKQLLSAFPKANTIMSLTSLCASLLANNKERRHSMREASLMSKPIGEDIEYDSFGNPVHRS